MSILSLQLKKLIKNLGNNFNSEGIYNFFDNIEAIKEKTIQKYISETFEELDEKIFLSECDKETFIVHSKKKRNIETIFGNITFYRRYYFNQKTKKYQFLLDKKLDIDKWERIHKQLKLLVLENASGNINYNQVLKTLKNANISVMSVSNILNKTNLSELSEFLNEMEAKPIPLKNNVIYFQADDTYICVKGKKKKLKQLKTGRWVKARNWKVFRVVTVHTGYNIIAKLGLANKRVFTFEIKDWSWTKTDLVK